MQRVSRRVASAGSSSDLHARGRLEPLPTSPESSLRLTIEHRSAPALEPCALELALEPAPHLRVLEAGGLEHSDDTAERVNALVAASLDLSSARTPP